MKQVPFLAIFFILSLSHNVNSQFLNNENAVKLKKSKIIVGLTNDSTTNAWLLQAVKSSWTISEDYETLPIKEAIKKLKAEGNITIIQLGVDVTHRTEEFNGWEIEIESRGGYIGLNTKGYDEADLMQHLSYNSRAQFVFGLSSLQDAVNTIVEENLSGMSKVREVYASRKKDLKGKTLYICENFVSKDVTVSDIKTAYSGDVELVSIEKFENIILNKKENAVCLNFVTVPVGDTKRSVAYFFGCDNQQTYDIFVNGKANWVNKKTLKKMSKLYN